MTKIPELILKGLWWWIGNNKQKGLISDTLNQVFVDQKKQLMFS